MYQAVDIYVLLCDSFIFAFLTMLNQYTIHCWCQLAISDFPVELNFEEDLDMWS